MFDQLDAGSPTPLYEQIARRVRAAIAAGEVRPGSPLPSVRQFASDLRVNPATVSQAYRELERDGFVTRRRGAGTFVKALSTDRREAESRAQATSLVRRLLDEALRLGVPGHELIEALEAELAASSSTRRPSEREQAEAGRG